MENFSNINCSVSHVTFLDEKRESESAEKEIVYKFTIMLKRKSFVMQNFPIFRFEYRTAWTRRGNCHLTNYR